MLPSVTNLDIAKPTLKLEALKTLEPTGSPSRWQGSMRVDVVDAEINETCETS